MDSLECGSRDAVAEETEISLMVLTLASLLTQSSAPPKLPKAINGATVDSDTMEGKVNVIAIVLAPSDMF